MKTLLKSLKITLAFCVFFSVFYILIPVSYTHLTLPTNSLV